MTFRVALSCLCLLFSMVGCIRDVPIADDDQPLSEESETQSPHSPMEDIENMSDGDNPSAIEDTDGPEVDPTPEIEVPEDIDSPDEEDEEAPVDPESEVDVDDDEESIVNLCPVAIAAIASPSANVDDIVQLSGAESVDPSSANGRPVLFQWRVVEKPINSVNTVVEMAFGPGMPMEEDDQDTPRAAFVVDQPGRYVFELSITGANELISPSEDCPSSFSRVELMGIPSDDDIRVELVWDTPGDDDQTDSFGSDLDLHLLHPNGLDWFDHGGWDCYALNPRPQWGDLEDPTDDAQLDSDDSDGAGPEVITLERAEDSVNLAGAYVVGVHLYRNASIQNRSYGPNEATVRIYFRGRLALEISRVLEEERIFWEAASITWGANGGMAVPRDRVYHRDPI